MNRQELESRTLAFAASIISFVDDLPKRRSADVIARQLLRSATSIGANYREANRAESKKDFAHKIGIVAKEAAETEYWLQLIELSGMADGSKLLRETDELLRIFIAIGRTTRQNLKEPSTVRESELDESFYSLLPE